MFDTRADAVTLHDMASTKRPTREYPPAGTAIALRVPDDLLAAIEAERERLQKERPGRVVTRAEVVREATARQLMPAKPRRP